MSFRRRLGVLRGDLVGRLDYLQFATRISSLRRRSVARSATQHSQPVTAPPPTARSWPAGEPGGSAATRPTPGGRAGRSRPKVAVLAWDVGHNPLGRAYVLAGVLGRRFDVEIWGAQFERYGTKVWAPLRDCEIPIHAFDGRTFPSTSASWR